MLYNKNLGQHAVLLRISQRNITRIYQKHTARRSHDIVKLQCKGPDVKLRPSDIQYYSYEILDIVIGLGLTFS